MSGNDGTPDPRENYAKAPLDVSTEPTCPTCGKPKVEGLYSVCSDAWHIFSPTPTTDIRAAIAEDANLTINGPAMDAIMRHLNTQLAAERAAITDYIELQEADTSAGQRIKDFVDSRKPIRDIFVPPNDPDTNVTIHKVK